jgi:hypothetical protein
MSVPTHNLYDFVHQVTKRQFWLIYFYPWGSRDLVNLVEYQVDTTFLNGAHGIPAEHWSVLKKFALLDKTTPLVLSLARWTIPNMICHDQEPLNFSLYNIDSEQVKKFKIPIKFPNLSLNMSNAFSIHKKSILLHSELNSKELAQFEDSGLFAGAYWWSHAAIARDWYRFAEHDTSLLCRDQPIKKLFLTYCRGQDGSRTYRKDFLTQLQRTDLYNNCRVTSESQLPPESYQSAEYCSADFNDTGISVVLETTFDDRIHLTEKTLRPIACGHPFLLAGGPGSLQLLRNYGFKTFHTVINEDYDHVADSTQRLTCIIQEMQRLHTMNPSQLDHVLTECKIIADHNKKWFFSNDFFQIVTDELARNVQAAKEQVTGQYTVEPWLNTRRTFRKNRVPVRKEQGISTMIRLIRLLRQSHQITDDQ